MKWTAIANVTGQLNDEAKGYLIRKLEQDTAVEAPNLWSDIIRDTTKHLHDSQSHLEVTTDEKTGSLTCLTNFDPMHEDFLSNNKPFAEYALGKYDQRAAEVLGRAKNPLTRPFLEQRIGNYRMHLAENLSSTEVKLIDGKRHSMAIDAIEKLKNATYDNPHLYTQNLEDGLTAISSLSLLPQEKDRLLQSAKEDLAYAAALSTLRRSPEAVLNPNASSHFPWKSDLSFETRVKLEHQAHHQIEHKQQMIERQLSSLEQSHFENILKTGEGIRGFDNLVQAALAPNDPRRLALAQKEDIHKQAFIVSQDVKRLPFDEGYKLINQLASQNEDEVDDYNHAMSAQVYNILLKQQDEQVKTARADPAKYVEELFIDEIPSSMPFTQKLVYRKNLQAQKGIPAHERRYLMNSERQESLRRIISKVNSGNVNEITNEIDSIIAIGADNHNHKIGVEIVGEILKDQEGLAPAAHFYIENHLYKNASKERGYLASKFATMLTIGETLTKSGVDNQNKPAKKEREKELQDNQTLKTWKSDFITFQPHNIKDATITEKGISDLAQYNNLILGMKPKAAVENAVEEMITNCYFSPLEEVQVPRQIIDNGAIHNLNEEYVKNSLINIRRNIIHGQIPFDLEATYGGDATSTAILSNEGVSDTRQRELANGRWFLSPDKKDVFYAYLHKSGLYRPIMKDSGNPLTFSLVDLNIPETLEQRLQRNNEELYEVLHTMPKYRMLRH